MTVPWQSQCLPAGERCCRHRPPVGFPRPPSPPILSHQCSHGPSGADILDVDAHVVCAVPHLRAQPHSACHLR